MSLMPFDNDDLFDSFNPFSDSVFSNKFFQKNSLRLDIIEKDSCFKVFADIPAGASKNDIKLEFENGYLTLNVSVKSECDCNPKDEKCKCSGRFVVKERYNAHYSRRVYLGDNLNREGIKAIFVNNVLEVTVPKLSDSAKKKFIDIS